MREHHVPIPIRPGLDWTKQSQFYMLELCSVGIYKTHELDQWYIDQYMSKFGVEQIIPSRLSDLYGHRAIRLKGAEDDRTVQFILSNIVMYSKRTLENFLDDALGKEYQTAITARRISQQSSSTARSCLKESP